MYGLIRHFMSRFCVRGTALDSGECRIARATPEAANDDCPIMGTEPVNLQVILAGWPDDPDEVPDWIIACERRRARAGITPIRAPIRTRREFEGAVALIRARLEHEDTLILHPVLSPTEAAHEFVSTLRATERTGQYASDELSAAYLDHCTATSRRPCPENLLRRELAKLPGVHSYTANRRIGRERYRPKVWVISDGTSVETAESQGPSTHALSYEFEDRRLAA